MNPHTIRFVQASDLHLDRPIQIAADVPEHLVGDLLDAPFQAAQAVFDLAVDEQADFLLLAGDVIDARRAEPHGLAFLLAQFERLAERNISVYWIAGESDPSGAWPAEVSLPAGVQLVSSSKVQRLVHYRDQEPVIAIYAAGRAARGAVPVAKLGGDDETLPSIGVAYGDVTEAVLARQKVRYLALGGRHRHQCFENSGRRADYSGTPQARRSHETGRRGCLLVEYTAQGQEDELYVREVITDRTRWLQERIDLPAGSSRRRLESLLAQRIGKLSETAAGRHLLLRWHITAGGAWGRSLRSDAGRESLLTWLREEFGRGSPAVWTAEIEVQQRDAVAEEWFEEDTLLGDYLRLVRTYQEDETLPLDIEAYLSESQQAGEAGELLAFEDGTARREALRQAALLGAQHLLGQGDGVATRRVAE